MTLTPPLPPQLLEPALAPTLYQQTRAVPYLTISQYRFAPTAVGTQALVQSSTAERPDSDSSLYQVIARVSSKIDEYCFRQPSGSFASSLTVEQSAVKVKPNRSLTFLVDNPPIRYLTGLALGALPGGLGPVSSNLGPNIQIGRASFTLPSVALSQGSNQPYYSPGWAATTGTVYGQYSYVQGWPHLYLAASCAAQADTITVAPTVSYDTTLYNVLVGSALTIKDNGNTETVVVQSASGFTLTLASPTQYAHVVPPSPDGIFVTALPAVVEEAAIALVSVNLKMQGSRAQQMPGALGAPSAGARLAMSRAGALGDWETACSNLKAFRSVFVHA